MLLTFLRLSIATCWERADLFALVGDVYYFFVTSPCGILGQLWYLIVSCPDLCCLSYFVNQTNNLELHKVKLV